MFSTTESNFEAIVCSSVGSWFNKSLFIIHLQCKRGSRSQVVQSARNEHSYRCFAFAEHQTGLGGAQFAKEAQNDRFCPVPADRSERSNESIQLETLRRSLIGGQTGSRDVQRGIQRDFGLVAPPSEKEGALA